MRPGEEGIDDDNPLRRMERMTQQPALFEPPPNKMNRLVETGATTRREQQLERNAKFEKLRQMERAMGVDQAQAKANWDRMVIGQGRSLEQHSLQVHEHEIHKMYHPTALGVSHSPVAFMPNDPMLRCVPADYAWPQSLTNLDTKVPSQKLQYFPDASGASMATNGLVPPMLGDKGEQFFHSGRAC